MLSAMSSAELTGWRAYFRFKAQEAADQQTVEGRGAGGPPISVHQRALAERDQAHRDLLAGRITEMPKFPNVAPDLPPGLEDLIQATEPSVGDTLG